jgi:hypothetical protein
VVLLGSILLVLAVSMVWYTVRSIVRDDI